MRLPALVSACALLVAFDGVSRAEDAASDPVVVVVGQSRVTVSELQFLLGRLHPFERESFGKTPAEVRSAFLQKRLLPELLMAEESRRRGYPNDPRAQARFRAALGQALKEDLERSFDAKLTRSELEAYCRSNEPADAGAKLCDGDLSGYRVALRRKRASEELERLARELREKHVQATDYRLLEQVPIRTDESASGAPTANEQKPEP